MNLQPAFLVSCRLRAALYPPNLASPALWFLLALVTVVLFSIANSTFAAGRGPAAASPNFAAGHILVAPESGSANTDFQQALIAQGGHSLGRLHGTDVHMVGVPVGSEQDAVARLAGNPNVRFAELDQLASPAGSGADSDLRNELRLASIHAPETRTATTRDSTIGIVVTIAILDSGVDDAQPDLAGQLVPGWNFFDNNNDTSDAVGHGTAVAGAAVVASSADAGVAGSARIMPVRIADAAGYAYWSTAAQGLTWAADQGAQVANINFEGMAASSTMEAAAIYFRSKGGTIVVAAANTGRVGDAATAKRGPIHACKRGNPTITITPSQSAGVQAGTMVPFSVTVTNNDASACNVSTFDMSHSQPSGWTATFSSGVISLSPGASNSTTLQVTSPAATSDSSNPITATATNREANTSRGSASATYVVANAVPGAPSIGTATAGNTQATVSFTAPASNGGSAITSYTVTSNPGAISASGAASPITVPGLINGTAYTFTVQAINAVGPGAASAASNSVTPMAAGGNFYSDRKCVV